MADKKISQLTNLTGASLAEDDEFVLVDTSADETKAITWSELKDGLDTGTGFVRITGDTMTGDLHIDGTGTELLITEDSEGSATLRFGDTQNDPAQSFAIAYDTASNKANFKVNNTQRANFNAAGDYMVGPATTDSPFTIYNGNNDATKAGVGLRQVGYIAAARMNDHTMMLNRMGTDGLTMGIRNDGTFVGGLGNVGGELTFHDSTTAEAMRLDSSGNLGIGTTNPATPLDVTGTITATSFAGDGSSLTSVVQTTAATGQANLPAGTTAQRTATPSTGALRFNSTDVSFEGYNGTEWGSIGGGGGASEGIFYENDQALAVDYTIVATKNAMTAGPITVNAGVTVTIETGGRWVVL